MEGYNLGTIEFMELDLMDPTVIYDNESETLYKLTVYDSPPSVIGMSVLKDSKNVFFSAIEKNLTGDIFLDIKLTPEGYQKLQLQLKDALDAYYAKKAQELAPVSGVKHRRNNMAMNNNENMGNTNRRQTKRMRGGRRKRKQTRRRT